MKSYISIRWCELDSWRWQAVSANLRFLIITLNRGCGWGGGDGRTLESSPSLDDVITVVGTLCRSAVVHCYSTAQHSTARQTDRQTARQTDRQTHRQTHRQTVTIMLTRVNGPCYFRCLQRPSIMSTLSAWCRRRQTFGLHLPVDWVREGEVQLFTHLRSSHSIKLIYKQWSSISI